MSRLLFVFYFFEAEGNGIRLRDQIEIIESGKMKLRNLWREESNDELFFVTVKGQGKFCRMP